MFSRVFRSRMWVCVFALGSLVLPVLRAADPGADRVHGTLTEIDGLRVLLSEGSVLAVVDVMSVRVANLREVVGRCAV